MTLERICVYSADSGRSISTYDINPDIKRLRQLLAMLLLLVLVTGHLQAKTHKVGPDQQYSTLTEAIKIASSGDSIVIFGGEFHEPTIVIDKPLSIQGIDQPIFDGDNLRQVITVAADNVRIRGITIARCGSSFIDDLAGIKVEEVNNCLIEDCRFVDNFFAIYLAKSAGSKVVGNQITAQNNRQSSSGNGIHLWYCRDVFIADNNVQGHRDGIYFEFVQDGEIRNNFSSRNLRYGLHFMFSDRCRYIENTFRNNGAGVAVMYTREVGMENNNFEDNWGSASFGLLLKDISDSHITANNFSGNSIAIYMENSSRVKIANNDFSSNGRAMRIMANCMDNEVEMNNFVGNAFDVTTNSRNNFNRFTGNYWSSYQGYDLNHDGVGDIPFHPVRLFSLVVERFPSSLILLRSVFVDVLDVAERVFPVLTPETLVDNMPAMGKIKR